MFRTIGNKSRPATSIQPLDITHLNSWMRVPETELNKIDPAISINSVSVLALQLGIAYGRKDWNKMKTLARQLFLLEPGNPKWPYSHGFATAKLIQTENQIKLKQKAFDG